MNYALDALWWRLQQPVVRDLASLLTAPSLWHSACELPRQTLIGAAGFRYLLDLDKRPERLTHYLQHTGRASHRLGFYAEDLLAFWLSQAPHCQLLGRNMVLQASPSSPTLGALDFVARIDGQLYHLELTCKYYAHHHATADGLRGINAADTLARKAAKLQQQLKLSQHELFGHWCARHQLCPEHIQAASVVRGMGFWQGDAVEAPINPHANRGDYLEKLSAWTHVNGCRYAAVPSLRLLSPLRLPEAQTLAALPDDTEAGIWWAQLQWRPDGYWHEINRAMCLPQHVGFNLS